MGGGGEGAFFVGGAFCAPFRKKRIIDEDKSSVFHANAKLHTHTHRMTRMTGPDCAVMCNLINKHTHTAQDAGGLHDEGL